MPINETTPPMPPMRPPPCRANARPKDAIQRVGTTCRPHHQARVFRRSTHPPRWDCIRSASAGNAAPRVAAPIPARMDAISERRTRATPPAPQNIWTNKASPIPGTGHLGHRPANEVNPQSLFRVGTDGGEMRSPLRSFAANRLRLRRRNGPGPPVEILALGHLGRGRRRGARLQLVMRLKFLHSGIHTRHGAGSRGRRKTHIADPMSLAATWRRAYRSCGQTDSAAQWF